MKKWLIKFFQKKKPVCFGSNPSYQTQAENDCEECDFSIQCLSINKRR